MKIAVQEDMLPGRSVLEKFENAQKLGIDGIEFWGRGLTRKVPDIVAAIEQTGVLAASVNHGRQSRFLDPIPQERERAMDELRESIKNAVDIGAAGVIYVPHFHNPILPDLSPWKSAAELEAEMVFHQLRVFLADFCHALGSTLYLEPINRYETHLLNRLEQAAAITRRLDQPQIKIVADLFHMALEERDIPASIIEHADDIGHVHVADSNRRLPGLGSTDFAAAAKALVEAGYDGWVAYECGDPSNNQAYAKEYMAALPESLEVLRRAGFV